MNQNDQEFEQVRKLLKLKQHEVPPPGYFNNFSSEVISRIRAGEASKSQSFAERLQNEVGWLYRIFQVFETRPGIVGGFATSLCLLLLLTVVFAERSEVAPGNFITLSAPATGTTGALANASEPGPNPAASILASTEPAQAEGGITINTNPAPSLQPNPMLFGQPASASLFKMASFAPANQ